MAVDRDHVLNGFGQQCGTKGQLCRELALAGVELLISSGRAKTFACGATMLVDVDAMQRSDAAAAQFRQRAFDVLADGLTLSVSFREMGERNAAYAAFSNVCEILQRAVEDAGVSPQQVEVVVAGEALLPHEASIFCNEHLGDGVVHVGLPVSQLDQHDKFWRQLWLARDSRNVRAAYPMQVLPACPLLTAETADCVLPTTGIQVPAGTAWLSMSLDMTWFADDNGVLCESAIEHALRRCVEIGDLLHEHAHWPTPQMRHDAWLNRRLAIMLGGFGDLALRRKLDPERFASLRELCDLLRWMREILQERSRAIARKIRHIPALDQCDPSRVLPGGHMREDWHTRWLVAVDSAAVRHRNLVVLSPWSVFPAGQPADYRYADLLPLLRFADACALSGAPSLTPWNINEFKGFHRRAWAVLEQRDAARQIAERI